MQSLQKHIILLVAILLWSCVSVIASEVDMAHLLKYSYSSGERTVKSSRENAAMFVNAEFAGGTTNTAKFSLYVSPYLVASQGGRYTKHVYIGSQRIVSKLGDLKSYGADPRRIEYAELQQVIKDNIEERNNVWNTPYLFNAKEFDEETGLYYYGARYYDSRLSMWYGVDALAEKYPNTGMRIVRGICNCGM